MVALLVLLSGAYPLFLAWIANRRTTLIHPLSWAIAAWTVWVLALLLSIMDSATAILARYAALCLTGCAGVAVLGARKPGAMAWNFVVLALLVVLLLPLAEGLGELHLEPLRIIFLAGTLAVGLLNYLPTRLATVMVCLAIGCTVELLLFANMASARPTLDRAAPFTRLLLALAPLAAWQRLRAGRVVESEGDGIWQRFRDRYGLVWGQRVREQFNNAATHAGWPVRLSWRGFRIQSAEAILETREQEEIVATLRALLKRFEDVEATSGQTPEGGHSRSV